MKLFAFFFMLLLFSGAFSQSTSKKILLFDQAEIQRNDIPYDAKEVFEFNFINKNFKIMYFNKSNYKFKIIF